MEKRMPRPLHNRAAPRCQAKYGDKPACFFQAGRGMNGTTVLVLLVAYGLLVVLASLAGGWALIYLRLTHARLQVATSLVAGLMLGVSLLHLLPHSWHQLHSLDVAVAWMMGGFLVIFFIQRFFHFHHHDVPEETAAADLVHHGHDHGTAHDPACRGHSLAEQSARRLSWAGATLGLFLHSVLDGVAVAASVQAESHLHGHEHGILAGVGTFLVVFLHKPFDAMAVGTLLARGNYSKSFRHWINGLLALALPIGMVTTRRRTVRRSWARPWRFPPAPSSASPPVICFPNCNSTLTTAGSSRARCCWAWAWRR
jgi:zinc transporter ZupT